ncbi:MAG: DMT family transporter [Rhodospirillaceae bacterium]
MALMATVNGSSAPGRAILLMLAGGFLLTVNDAVMKWLTGGYPVGQLLLVRSAFSILFIMGLMRFTGGIESLRVRNWRLHLVRSTAVVAGTFFFVSGLQYLTLAEATAVVFAGPLFITALAPVLIGEHVGWRRWTAVMIGFTGVMIIVRPGSDAMQWAVMFPLASAMTGALRDLVTRAASTTEKSTALLATGTVVTGIGGLCSYPFGWADIALPDFGLMALSGILMAGAHFMVIESFRHGEAAMVAPFKYSNMIYAVALGFLIWGDLPDLWTWAGTAVLISSGLYILYRERQVGADIPRTGTSGGAGG